MPEIGLSAVDTKIISSFWAKIARSSWRTGEREQNSKIVKTSNLREGAKSRLM